MKQRDLPYTYENFAEQHDILYHSNNIVKKHDEFELSLVKKILSKKDHTSWCDAACGSGWHIRQSGIEKNVVGVDREPNMIEYAKNQSAHPSQKWSLCDVKNIKEKVGTFDLTTHFWLGYIHQITLDDVKDFFTGLINSVNPQGTLFITICNPLRYFDNIDFSNPIIFENPLFIDAIIWRYTDPITNTNYENCIAPHPALMHEWLFPHFERISIIDYPRGDGSPKWQRKAFLCEGKKSSD